MTSATLSPSLGTSTKATEGAGSGTLLLYTLTTLLSALLLFSIQPMFAKMVLPILGGSPSVWAVALAFFQGALLAGYCYAHALIRYLPAKMTGFVHLGFCLIAFLALPIALPESWAEPPPGDAYMWQFGLFAVAIGLPFMAVAANSPLLQAWFARTGHAQSADPYFLYAASNLGSFFALLGYPLLLEPMFGVSALSGYWMVGYLGLIASIGLCFVVVWQRQTAKSDAPIEAASNNDKLQHVVPTWTNRLTWVGLALVPSALLTAYTTHIATDVASAPLIWVVPLAIYLLTFVSVFRESSDVKPGEEGKYDPFDAVHVLTIFLIFLLLSQNAYGSWIASSTLGLAAFICGTLVAHRTLYQTRPNASSLTEFYIWMSFGGVLGGLFAALVAPKIFSEVFEYPLLLALTLACRPGVVAALRNGTSDYKSGAVKIVAGLGAAFGAAWICSKMGWTFGVWGAALPIVGVMSLGLVYFWNKPVQQLAVALMLVAVLVVLPTAVHVGNAQRSYFGVYRVIKSDDGEYTILQHGSTVHGAQRTHDKDGKPVKDLRPVTYYYSGGPIHDAIAHAQARLDGEDSKGRFGVVGLGTGALACHARKGEDWRFYEIDPVVVQIAQSPSFSYLAECQPNADVVVGDARLTVAKEPDASFDLLVIDAFSSDAVPMHLLTREALQLYVDKLTPEGVGVLHISNRHLDLEGVLHQTMKGIDGVTMVAFEKMVYTKRYDKVSAHVAVFSKDPKVANSFLSIKGARAPHFADIKPWTDDASDILGPFMSKLDRNH